MELNFPSNKPITQELEEVKMCRWKWIGHVHRMPSLCRVASVSELDGHLIATGKEVDPRRRGEEPWYGNLRDKGTWLHSFESEHFTINTCVRPRRHALVSLRQAAPSQRQAAPSSFFFFFLRKNNFLGAHCTNCVAHNLCNVPSENNYARESALKM